MSWVRLNTIYGSQLVNLDHVVKVHPQGGQPTARCVLTFREDVPDLIALHAVGEIEQALIMTGNSYRDITGGTHE